MKNYKVLPPEQTINKIRNILNELGILLYEKHIIQEGLYSCRLTIGNRDLLPLKIGTNGKGRTFEYSLASGYAEFMERLQNYLLLDIRKITDGKTINNYNFQDDIITGMATGDTDFFSYDINEKEVLPNYFKGTLVEELKKLAGEVSDLDLKRFVDTTNKTMLTAIPFYSVNTKEEIFLPIKYLHMMTGSNGMAAGNSPKEAILQAICEIFERYTINEIYWKQLTPPTIPFDYFKGTSIYDQLCHYKNKTNYELIIKDCSLGIGIPAIGLIIIDRVNQLYNFIIGVDCVPAVALERCITEIHQGTTDFHGLSYKFIDTNFSSQEEKSRNVNNLMNIMINGSGYWPDSIFKEKKSYDFHGYDKQLGISNATDLNYCIELLKRLGHNIYIRDNSSLGFPAYYVVIPGMSQIHPMKIFSLEEYTDSFKEKIWYINCLGRINVEMAESILLAIEENYQSMISKDVSLSNLFVYNINPDLNNLSIEMLAALLSYYLGNKVKCLKYMELHLACKNRFEYRYFYACSDFLKLEITGNSESLNILSQLYGENIAKEVANDLSVPTNIFQYYKLPNCPHCTSCKLYSDCRVRQIRDINSKIKKCQKDNPIQQSRIQYLIECPGD